MTRVGKIGQLPEHIRTEINLRILNGALAPDVLPWLNELPEVKDILARKFGGEEISPQNFSAWRKGGFAEWKSRRERLDHTRELAKYSAEIAKAGGKSLSDGASSILAGRILEVMEQLDELARPPEDDAETSGGTFYPEKEAEEQAKKGERLKLIAESIEGLTLAVSRLRKGDQGAENLELLRERLKQSADALELEQKKFRRTTCELFLKWAEDQRALDIAHGNGSTGDKTEALGLLMFGDLWEPDRKAEGRGQKAEPRATP